MALVVNLPFRSGPSWGTVSHPIVSSLEANSSTFKIGSVIIVNASGLLTEGGVNPVSIFGIAAQAGQNGTSKVGQFQPAAPNLVFEGQLDTTAGGLALAQTDLGAQYGITKDSTSTFWFVDVTKTGANARVTLVGFRDAVLATTARVYFIFKAGSTAYA